MNKNVTLTVLIPTFNGHNHLDETLQSINYSLPNPSQIKISVTVCDNGSSEPSSSKIAEICHRHRVNLVRFDQNLGFDCNIQRAMGVVDSSHVWLLGDDDVLAPEALAEACRVMSDTESGFILAPPKFFRDGEIYSFSTRHREAATIFPNAEELLKSTLWNSSALSSHIWHTDSWRGLNLEGFESADWIHFAALVTLSKSSSASAALLPAGLVQVRIGVTRWEAHFGNSYISGLKQLAVIQLAASSTLFSVFQQARLQTNFRDAFFLTSTLNSNQKRLAKSLMIQTFGLRPRVAAVDIPFLYAPSSLKRAVLSAGKLIKKLFGISRSALEMPGALSGD